MISFPNAKINLGLHIISKRPDSFHNIETLFYPIQWLDILEIIPSHTVKFSSTGIPIPGDIKNNLCLKAYDLLSLEYTLPPVNIHLHKIIPIGAGLGGGSADAAFTLINLNEQFELGLEDEKLLSFAKKLGSDCAFFIKNQPVLASGKGDEFLDCSISLSNKYIIVIHPQIHISTPQAYAGVSPKFPDVPLKEVLRKSVNDWKGILVNDFESSVFKEHPLLRKIKEQLYNLGAVYSAMSGSGSAIYGIFEKAPEKDLPFPGTYSIYQGTLL